MTHTTQHRPHTTHAQHKHPLTLSHSRFHTRTHARTLMRAGTDVRTYAHTTHTLTRTHRHACSSETYLTLPRRSGSVVMSHQ